jgi:hypothetical protein
MGQTLKVLATKESYREDWFKKAGFDMFKCTRIGSALDDLVLVLYRRPIHYCKGFLLCKNAVL